MKSWTWLSALVIIAGCQDTSTEDGTATPSDTDTPAPLECQTENEDCGPGTCSTGEGSPKMLPGADCMACHVSGKLEDKTGAALKGWVPQEDDELFFTIAGTAFQDKQGTAGLSNATIRVTDSTGKVVTLTSNSVGNFYSAEPVIPPLTAEVESGGQVKYMGSEVYTGACNSCHVCDGTPGGKLYAP